MRASYTWLKELSSVDLSAEEMAARLTRAGLEVEAEEEFGRGLESVVVAEVQGSRPHPKREKLTLVTIVDGQGEHEIVCGAPNVPPPGKRVLFARLGASLPNGLEIAEREIAGVVSRGMLCGETELGIGSDDDGIVVLGDDEPGRPGDPIAETFGLRDVVFEIGLTPNRPDCLGHVGLAREVALLAEKSFAPRPPTAPTRLVETKNALVPASPSRFELARAWQAGSSETRGTDAAGLGPIAVEILDPIRCPRYGAALVLDLTPGPSPLWLRSRLHRLGVRAISNVVDVTNLVMLEWGHPIHGFDLERLRGRRIIVRTAVDGETMPTLDGLERVFTSDDLLIADGEGPVAVAGVMGGKESGIGASTRHVLIECAYFDPRSVRRTARRLGMHTDASHRFERGVDPNAVPQVLARAASLMAELGGGAVVPDALDVHPRPIDPVTISLRARRIAHVLGADVPGAEVRRILEGVGCRLESAGEDFTATAPTDRPDLTREIDLIEEIARVRGYDAIPTHLPQVHPSNEGIPERIQFARRAKQLAATVGLFEAVNYAFLSPRELEHARTSREVVPLLNPLSEERSVMRTSLLPGLAANARHSQRRQAARIRLFELSRTFHPNPGQVLPTERKVLAFLIAGPRDAWIGEGDPVDFYDGKGLAEALVGPLVGAPPKARIEPQLAAETPFLHPRRSAALDLDGARIGVLGELHPDVRDALELEGSVVYCELDFDALFAVASGRGEPQAALLPRFPAVHRDLAFVVRDEHSAEAISAVLREAAAGLAESVELFDLYRGTPVPEGHKSLAFRIVYRDPEATLTDERVDAAHRDAAQAVATRFQAQLRT